MARHKTPTLTEAELKIMDIVWELGEATVNDVVDAQSGKRQLAYNTILTMMRILEQKGYLRREKAGRAHLYQPVVDRKQARTSAVRHMLRSFFNDSPELLMVNLLESDSLSEEELHRLRQMIADNDDSDNGEGR
ncbi:BlaI/MecI/CopY family transcriptional regulator [candidate division GN15 bacterium]|nr:BlaI/MecI/CopY family transcriptional regulator [candidate division GN15 bacterium]